MKKIAPFLILFALCFTALAADTVVEDIVARINNNIITRSDLLHANEQATQEVREKMGNTAQAEEEIKKGEPNVLRDLIDQQLLVQKATDDGITGDTELIKKLDEIRKQMGLKDMDELAEAAKKQGISYEDFKQNLRNQIVTQQVISREVGSHIQITKEEVQKFYDDHKSEFERPEQVRLSEILIAPKTPPAAPNADKNAPPPQPTEADVQAAETKANELLAEIKKGAKFEDIAVKYSDGPSAQQGGDLSYFDRGKLAKELEDLTFGMKAGEVSNVIRTKQGFVILKVTEHNQAGLQPLKDVDQEINQAVYLDKLQPALRDYLTKLREDAFIDIKPGFVDTGASPNQHNPIYTTAAADTTKAKPAKKKKKLLIF